MNDDLELRLTSDEALVLFDWIHRMEDERYANVPVAHKGELAALWHLNAVLETVVVESFSADYRELVEAARERLRRFAFSDEDD